MSNPVISSPAKGGAAVPVTFFGFLGRSFLAALLLGALAGGIDAALARLLQADRSFSERLLFESLVAHGSVCVLAAFLLSIVYRILPSRTRSRITAGCPVLFSLSVLFSLYFLVFVGFYYYVDMVGTKEDLGKLRSYPALAFGGLLLVSSIAMGRLSYRLLHGPDAARAGRSGSPALRLALTVIVLATAGAGGFFLIPEIRKPAALAAGDEPRSLSAEARPRNVILLVMDTTRRDRLSVYGHDRATSPNLERIAREGTIFTQASSTATYTLSSHASILTGLVPSRHGATMRTGRLDDGSFSLAQTLRDSGHTTGAFVANRVLRLESGIGRGFDHYDDAVDPEVCQTAAWDVAHNLQALAAELYSPLGGNGQPHWIEDHQRSAEDQNVEILEWIDSLGNEPFFLFANYYDPHWPYLPEEEWRAKFAVDYDGPVTGYLFRDNDFPEGYQLTREDNEYLLSLYDAEIAYLDHHIGLLLDALKKRGILDDTLLVITADHGEYFGEHGHYSHKELYEEAVGVPLLVRLPDRVAAGRVIETAVGLTDVVPTILELLGCATPDGLQGSSLVPYLSPEESPEEIATLASRTILSEDFDHSRIVRKMAREGALKLIRSYDGLANEELFDLGADPLEASNLLGGDPATAGTILEIATRLLSAIRALGPEPEPGSVTAGKPAPADLDRATREALEALGYLEDNG